MFNTKEFCAKSLVVVGFVACIPLVMSALGAVLYCWILWPPSKINAFKYVACIAWFAFAGFGVFLAVKWTLFERGLATGRSGTWLWIISAVYWGIIALVLLTWGYYLHNARRFDLRDWHGDELEPALSLLPFLLSAASVYAGTLCTMLLFLTRAKSSKT